MNSFWNKNRPVLLLVLFLGLSLFIFARSLRYQLQSRPNHLKLIISSAGYPLQKVFYIVLHGIVAGWQKYLYVGNLEQENTLLRRQLTQTRLLLYQYKEFDAAKKRMDTLVLFQQELEQDVLFATVIGRDIMNWFETMTIDVGTRDGVKIGLPVINKDGVVGQVSSCFPRTSTLMPLIHEDSGIAGIVQVSRVQGTVVGNGDGKCFFKYVDRKSIVSPGDLIVTSGLDQTFPKGLPIGRITTVKKIPNKLFLEIRLEPRVNFSRLEEVLVIKPVISITHKSPVELAK